MKHMVYYLIAFMLILSSCNNGTNSNQNQENAAVGFSTTVIFFDKIDHDFGTIKEGEKVTYAFNFTNKGKTDLHLLSVGTSCGCTASDYPREPIKPGKLGKIQITFDSAHRLGMQHKKITIRANTDPAFMELNIYAQVVDANTKN